MQNSFEVAMICCFLAVEFWLMDTEISAIIMTSVIYDLKDLFCTKGECTWILMMVAEEQ